MTGPPKNDEACGANAGQVGEQRKDNSPKDTAPAGARQTRIDHDEQLAELRREAALLGAVLHRLDTGAFLLTRWAWGRELPDLGAVRQLLDRMSGARR